MNRIQGRALLAACSLYAACIALTVACGGDPDAPEVDEIALEKQ